MEMSTSKLVVITSSFGSGKYFPCYLFNTMKDKSRYFDLNTYRLPVIYSVCSRIAAYRPRIILFSS